MPNLDRHFRRAVFNQSRSIGEVVLGRAVFLVFDGETARETAAAVGRRIQAGVAMTVLQRCILYGLFAIIAYGVVAGCHAPDWVAVLVLVGGWAYIDIQDSLMILTRRMEDRRADYDEDTVQPEKSELCR